MTASRRIAAGRIIGILALLVVAAELRCTFFGSLAFVRKPTLILAPIHAPRLEEQSIAEVRTVLERELAGGGNHALYPKSLIENFYLERDNATGVFDGSYRGRTEAFELGTALGVERVAVASVTGYSGTVKLSLEIHDIETDQTAVRMYVDFADLDGLLEWIDVDGSPVDTAEQIGSTVPGMSSGAWLYVIWLIVLGLVAVSFVIGFHPSRGILEWCMGIGVLLALFSWIYALNGDMDYVQRFVATSGLLDIADTGAERAATLWRYVPPMVLLLAAWLENLRRRFTRDRDAGAPSGAARAVDAFAPLLAGLSALLYAFSLPNIMVLEGIPVLAWIAAAPLYVALRRVRWGRGVSLVLFFIGLQSLLINWWQGTFSYVSLPFTVTLTLVQYLPFALILAALLRFFPRTGLWAAPLFWTAVDWLRSLGFLGYPWGILGVSQYAHPALIQISALGGVWAVSLLVHLGSSAWAFLLGAFLDGDVDLALLRHSITGGRRDGEGGFAPGGAYALRPWLPLFVLIIAAGATTAGGALALRSRDARKAVGIEEGEVRLLRILLVQQNTDPRKHDYHLSFEELSRLTEEALAEAGEAEAAGTAGDAGSSGITGDGSGNPPFDLVAWPESGFVPDVRFWLDESRARWRRGKLVRAFLDWQKGIGVPLVTGTQDHFYEDLPPSDDPEAPTEVKRIRNSAMYLPPDRTGDFDRDYYYKIRLVPFTENFPYGEQFPRVAELLHNFSTTQWTPGTEHHVFNAPRFRFSTPICFEDVFPDHVRRFVLAGADVLVNMSNDYWANTPLEGYQHAAHAVFRAVENRRPLVRATCSGWTISVDAEGRIADGWPPFYEPGWTVGEHFIPETPERTLYNRFGDWLPVLCGLVCLLLAAGELIFRRSGTSGGLRA